MQLVLLRPVREAHQAVATGPCYRYGVEPVPPFAEVYATYFDFVWRSVRRLGVPNGAIDDAVQDVFVVVHRRLGDFEGRSSLKTWIFGIVRRVVRDHRPLRHTATFVAEELYPEAELLQKSPLEEAARAEAARLIHRLLTALDEDKREAFVLAELEQMTVPEVAEALGANVNTIYARVRAARQELKEALAREQARATWRAQCAS